MRRLVIGGVAIAIVAVLVVVLVTRKHSSTASRAIGRSFAVGQLALRPGGASIAGTVRDASGKPLPGATVCADEAAGSAGACGMTGSTGAYSLTALPPGEYDVSGSAPQVRPARYRSGADRIATPIVLAANERRTGVDIRLEADAVALTGSVVDVNGGPIAHAQIRTRIMALHHRERMRWYPPVETDAAGAFTVWVAPGSVTVQASADGYAGAEVHEQAPGTLTIHMTPEASISGTVIDAKGAPVPDADVRAGYIDTHVATRSDASGAFRIPSLVPGRYVVSGRAERAYGEAASSVLVGLAQNVTGVVVRLAPAARVSGRVVTDAGTPCPGATAYLRDPQRTDDIRLSRDADGLLHADALMAGTYYVHPRCAGHFADTRYPPIVVAAESREGLTWKVHIGATLRGHVRDRSGAPLTDVAIRMRGEHYYDVVTAADGSFYVDAIAPGSYTLEASTGRGGRIETALVVAGIEPIERELVLEDGAQIKGFVRDAEGRPAANIQIAASTDDTSVSGEKPERETADPDGSYTLNVRPGRYSVYPSVDGFNALAAAQPVTLAPGQTATLDFVVPSAETGAIRGDVKDAAGEPVGDAYVSAYRSSGFGSAGWFAEFFATAVLTAADGTFEIRGIGPGAHEVKAVRRGGGEAATNGIEAGAEVHLVIPTTGSLAGTLAYPDGKAPDEVTLTVRSPDGFYRAERFYHSGGAFTLDELPGAELTIVAVALGGFGVATVTLAPGEAKTGVAIAMERNVTVTGRVVDAITAQPLPDYFVIPNTRRAKLGTTADSDDTSHLTDATGRFTVSAPLGEVDIGVFSSGFFDHLKCRMSFARTITGPVDLGDLPIVLSRLGKVRAGELGFEPAKLVVKSVAPPAATAGLRTGDVITSIDDVTGEPLAQCTRTLLAVPVGAVVKLGLASGKTVAITAAREN